MDVNYWNTIILESMRTRFEYNIVTAFITLLDKTNTRQFQWNLLVLNNEAPNKFCKILEKHAIQYQSAPPGNHQTNNVERSIQAFKNPFIAGLYSVHLNFPLQLWDRLVHHLNIRPNLICRS